MVDFLIDANVLIHIFRGNAQLALSIRTLDCAIDTTIYVELIQGAKNKVEVARIERSLKKFHLLHFSEDISRRTIDLIRNYSKSHGLLFGDAVIAATCLDNNATLVTLNAKDFRFIKGLDVRVPKL